MIPRTSVRGEFIYKHVVDFVKFVATRFPGMPICLSLAQPFIWFEDSKMKYIAQYSEIAPHLKMALNWCLENNVDFSGLHEACGIPLCFLNAEKNYFKTFRTATSSQSDDMATSKEFVKCKACAECAVSDMCFGIRIRYVKYYGTNEIKPVVTV